MTANSPKMPKTKKKVAKDYSLNFFNRSFGSFFPDNPGKTAIVSATKLEEIKRRGYKVEMSSVDGEITVYVHEDNIYVTRIKVDKKSKW